MHLVKCINFSFLSVECLICNFSQFDITPAIEEEFPSVETVSPSLSTTPSATPSATSSTKTSPVPSEMPSAQPEEGIGGEGGSDSQAVAIAVSTSLLTVLAVAVIVAVGVILCWRISTRNRYILSSSLLSYSLRVA